MPEDTLKPSNPISDFFKNNPKLIIITLVLIVVVSLIFNCFFGYSFKQTKKDSEQKDKIIKSLQSKLDSQTDETETEIPVEINGKIAYKKVRTSSTKTHIDTSETSVATSEIKKHEETTIKKNMGEIGVGYSLSGDKQIILGGQVISVIGVPINVKLTPDIDHFERSAAFISISL